MDTRLGSLPDLLQDCALPPLSKCNIALLADYENVAKPARENLDAIIAQAEREGKVVLRRAYANWGRFESHKSQMRAAGFEMIDVARTEVCPSRLLGRR